MIEALSIAFNGDASNNSLSIKGSVFWGATGSGLSVYLFNTSNNNSITVCLSYFTHNSHFGYSNNHKRAPGHHGSNHHGGGGGALFDDNSSHNKVIIIQKSKFINNSATSGGSLLILLWTSSDGNSIDIVYNGLYGLTHHPHEGGVISVHLTNNVCCTKISINRSSFTSNRAVWGAGMYIKF